MTRSKNEARPATDVSLAVGVFVRAAVAVILCYLVYIAIAIVFKGVFQRVDGYKIVTVDENGAVVETLAEVKYDDPSTHVGNKYDTLEENQRKLITYAEMPKAALTAQYVVTSIFMLLLLAVFPYKSLWDRGVKDRNLVQYGHAVADKWRGLRVGLFSQIPALVLYLCVVVSKMLAGGYAGNIDAAPLAVREFSKISVQLYHICNQPFMPFMNALEGAPAQYSFQVPWWALAVYVLILLYIPFVCWLGYTLGCREYSIKEHFIYKKTTNTHTSK